jgi:hypothetical protein
VGKHYDRTINEVKGLINLTECTQALASIDKIILSLASIASVLCDIDLNLAAIADALEEKKDDKTST